MFATPGVNIGLFCSTPMVAVSRKINRKPMMKMLLTGEPINANYGKEIGLINDYFSKSKLNNEVLKVANKIASKSNLTIKIRTRRSTNIQRKIYLAQSDKSRRSKIKVYVYSSLCFGSMES